VRQREGIYTNRSYLCGAVSVTTLTASRAAASPYVCRTAIRLPRDDSVAWLVVVLGKLRSI
jgi:hypothetical protein